METNYYAAYIIIDNRHFWALLTPKNEIREEGGKALW